jgi:hypothetical protein
MERDCQAALGRILSSTRCIEERMHNAQLLMCTYRKLNPIERTIVADANRAVAAEKRKGIRVLEALADRHKSKGRLEKAHKIEECKSQVIQDLIEACKLFIQAIDDILLPMSRDDHLGYIFWLKTKADFLRYQCECVEPSIKKELCAAAIECYEEAQVVLKSRCPKETSTALAIALNYGVTLYEIQGDVRAAVLMCQMALDSSGVLVNDGNDEDFTEATNLQERIRQNLTVWSRDVDQL